QIAAAREEMANEERVKAARSVSKSDPNVTAQQLQKARGTLVSANTKLREKVAAILTAEQKTLIEKINAAYAAAAEESNIAYTERFASVKGDEAGRHRLQDEKNQDMGERFRQKLDPLLTPGQTQA